MFETILKLGKKIVGWALSIVVCAWSVRNKPKTRKWEIVGWALSIVVCAWNVRNKPKTRKRKIVGWALSIVVWAWNVRNKPKTRKQTQNSETKNRGVYISLQIIRSRRSKKSFQYLFFLFFLKSIFLNKYWKDFLLRLELKIRISIDKKYWYFINTYSNFQHFKANESLESSSFVHCEYCIFKLLSASRINFFIFCIFVFIRAPRWVRSVANGKKNFDRIAEIWN